MRKPYFLIGLALAALTAVVAAQAATSESPTTAAGAFTYRGTVTHVVDGDTLDVRLTSGKTERIRLIGIDTPERGVCFSSQATARARTLAMSKPVVLRGDATQDTRDRYGRLLAYVWIPGGKDLGYQLLAGGFAKTYVYRDAFHAPARIPEGRGRGRRRHSGTVEGLWHDAGAEAQADAEAGRELPPVLFVLPANGRRPRLRRHPRDGRGAGSRARLRPVQARRRQRRLGLRVTNVRHVT